MTPILHIPLRRKQSALYLALFGITAAADEKMRHEMGRNFRVDLHLTNGRNLSAAITPEEVRGISPRGARGAVRLEGGRSKRDEYNCLGQRFCVFYSEICTPSFFSPLPYEVQIKKKHALNL